MYRELSERNRALFRVLLGLITGFLALLALPKWFEFGQYLWMYELFLFAVTVVVLYLVIQKILVGYAYTVIGDEFHIYRRLGSKETALCSVDLDAIVALRPVSELARTESEFGVKAEARYYGDLKDGQTVYVLVYPAGNAYGALRFAPSSQLVEILTQKRA